MATPDVLLTDIAFGEGPRWHDGALWFSDMHGHRVLRFDPSTGAADVVVEVEGEPSGLGWDAEGRLCVVSMVDRRLLRLSAPGVLEEVADLSGLTEHRINDMVIDAHGRAYIGSFGFDLHQGGTPQPTVLFAVDTATGAHTVAAEDLQFPNGMVITPDGGTLIVGESMAARLSAFSIAPDGSLRERREWASVAPAFPDGICLDAEGCVWVASPGTRECVRVGEGGEVVARVPTGDRMAIACMLGGADRRTLFILTSVGIDPVKAAELRTGRLEAVEVEVPGAGWP